MKSPTPSTEKTPRAPKVARFVIAAIPFLVVAFAVYAIGYGLYRLLRGDESLLPIIWAIVVPIGTVLGGLGAQMLLVKIVARRFETGEYDAPDDSSFL